MGAENRVAITITADGEIAKGVARDVSDSLTKMGRDGQAGASQARAGVEGLSSSMSDLKQLAATLGVAYALNEIAGATVGASLAAARYDTMGVSLRVLGENAGYTQAQMGGFDSSLQKTGISMAESRESLSKLTAAHLDLTRASELGRVAQNAAIVANVTSAEAFGRIVQGITTGQTILLHHMGIMVNLEDAYRKAASTMGLASTGLTDVEKRQVALNAVLDEGLKRTGLYEAAMGTAGKQLNSFNRYLDDTKVKFGEAFQPQLTALVEQATRVMKSLQDTVSSDTSRAQLKEIGDAFANFGRTLLNDAVPALRTVVGWLGKLGAAWNSMPKDIFGAAAGAAAGARVGGGIGGSIAGAPGAVIGTAVGAAAGGYYGYQAGSESDPKVALAKVNREIEEMKKWQIIGEQQRSAIWGSYSRFFSSDIFSSAPDPKDYLAKLQQQQDLLKAIDEELLARNQVVTDDSRMRAYRDTRNAERAASQRAYEANQVYTSGSAMEDKVSRMIQAPHTVFKLPEEQQWGQTQSRFGAAYTFLWNILSGNAPEGVAVNKTAAMDLIGKVSDTFQAEQEKHDKKGVSGDKQTVHFENMGKTAGETLKSLEDSLTGGLNKSVDQVDKTFTGLFARIAEGMTGAKGDTTALTELKKKLDAEWSYFRGLATIQDFAKQLDKEAAQLQDFAKLTGNIEQDMDAERLKARAKYNREMSSSDDEIRDQAYAKYQAYLDQENELRAKKLGDAGKLVADFYEGQAKRLQYSVEAMRKAGVDEVAIAEYVAAKKSELAKQVVEARVQYETDLGKYIQERLILDYKLYQDAGAKQRELWGQVYDAGIKAFDGIGKVVNDVFGSMLTDAAAGKLKTLQDYFKQFTDSIKSLFLQLLKDLMSIAIRNYIIIPIVTAFVGSEGSDGIMSQFGMGQANGKTGGGLDFQSIISRSKQSYDLYTGASSLFNSSGGTPFAGLGLAPGDVIASTSTGPVVFTSPAAAAEMGFTSTTPATASQIAASNTGFMSSFAMPLAGAALGFTLGNSIWSNGTGTVGSGVGAAGGAGLGFLVGGPIGGLIGGVIGGTAGGALTGHETRETTRVGGGLVAMVQDGELIPAAFGTYNTKVSGMGQWNEHSTSPEWLDNSTYNSMMKAYSDLRKNATDAATAMGFSSDSLKSLNTQLLANGGAGNDYSKIMDAIACAMAENIMRANGYTDAMSGLLQPSESFASALTRLSGEFTNVEKMAMLAGTSIETLSGTLDRMGQVAYADKLTQAMGGTDKLNSAFTLFIKNAITGPQQAQNAVDYAQLMLARTFATVPNGFGENNKTPIFNSDGGINTEQFWTNYTKAMSGPISPDEFKQWSDVASAVDLYTQALQAQKQAEVTALQNSTAQYQNYISVLQAQAQPLSQLASKLKELGDGFRKLKNDLLLDPQLSSLDSGARRDLARANLEADYAKASAGDADAAARVNDDVKSLLSASKDYFASSEGYFNDFAYSQQVLTNLSTIADSQYDVAVEQLAAIQAQIAQYQTMIDQNNAQIDAINNSAVTIAQAVSANQQTLRDQINAIRNRQTNPTSTTPGGDQPTSTQTTTQTNPTDTGGSYTLPGGGSTNDALFAMAMGSFTGLDPSFYAPSGYAEGGDHPGGWRIVGEEGPELELTGPSRIFDAGTTKSIISSLRPINVSVAGGDNAGVERILTAIYARDGEGYTKILAKLESVRVGVEDVEGRLRKVENRL